MGDFENPFVRAEARLQPTKTLMEQVANIGRTIAKGAEVVLDGYRTRRPAGQLATIHSIEDQRQRHAAAYFVDADSPIFVEDGNDMSEGA